MLLNIWSKYQSLLILNAKIVDATQKKLSKKTPGKCLHSDKVQRRCEDYTGMQRGQERLKAYYQFLATPRSLFGWRPWYKQH